MMSTEAAPLHQARIENGIIFMEFTHSPTVEEILELENEAAKLVVNNGNKVLPAIMQFINQGDLEYIHATHLGRFVNTEIFNHVSTFILVDTTVYGAELTRIANDLFFNNLLHSRKTLAEALEVAESFKHEDRPMFEQS